ncbi:MAG: alpha/beta hydrolase-fold protein [Bacteroidota bacterium]
MKNKFLSTIAVLLCFLHSIIIHAQETGVTIIDSRHYSHVFAELRNFRIFLPKGYYQHPEKRYPVIYFLHGWSQRYFGSGEDRYSEFDRADGKDGENMETFAAYHDVIIVKSDGYNRSADEDYYLRPYNVGPVETYRQFPIYFPELIDHVDATYRTKANRENRAVTGLSMGGFMAFLIGGKYPQLFCAVGNFCGSPEFVIGPKDLAVEYRHMDMYKNYAGMKVRLNYGDMDFIRGYHDDLNRVWTQVMDNYQYKIYAGGHTTSGFSEMFSFLFNSFNTPSPRPERWDHFDFYPEFSVWDYTISTDRIIPGFTMLENVDQRGFRSSVREFLPDGELIPSVNVSVVTAPEYEKNEWYTINDIYIKSQKTSQQTIRSDNNGRLKISLDGSVHEIGINKATDKPNIAVAGFTIKNSDWVMPRKETGIILHVVNKGMAIGDNMKAKLSAVTKDVLVTQDEIRLPRTGINEIKEAETPFVFKVVNDSVDMVKLKLTIHDGNKNEWIDFLEIPVLRDAPEVKDFVIADGKTFTVGTNGIDSITTTIGNGNGDGIANPGEMIELLVKDKGRYWRTQLFCADNYINQSGINIRKSDNWGNYDNVGGSMKYSVAVISSACPENHKAHFFAEYWLPDKPFHIIKYAGISIPVSGKDNTPPVLAWVKIPGDNIIQAKLYDGSAIKSVVAALTAKNKKKVTIELNDKARGGDVIDGDHVFSIAIPEQYFGIYKLMIEATDSLGNKLTQDVPGNFILH